MAACQAQAEPAGRAAHKQGHGAIILTQQQHIPAVTHLLTQQLLPKDFRIPTNELWQRNNTQLLPGLPRAGGVPFPAGISQPQGDVAPGDTG